jgi:hypothetical protein
MPVIIGGAGSGPGSIIDYDTLQQAVADWSHRDDLTSFIPTFIQLCEAELADYMLLKDMESDEALTLTVGRDYVALPSGFISPIAFWLVVDSIRVPLSFVMPEQLPYNTENSQPQIVAVDAGNLRFDCPASENYSAYLRCVKTSNLSDSNTSNALLLRRPDIYLYGSLKQLALYTQDSDLLAKYVGPIGLFDRAVRQLKATDSRSKSVANLRTDFGGGRRPNILIDG